MPRPKKCINFYCHCCEKYWMGEQDAHKNWDRTKINNKRCPSCRNKLFHGEHMRGVECDFEIETTNNLRGARY